ncbi:protease B [Myxococcus llanfairpwllgwyngyllgogerychwyrndrobwllllantysiliogogogochensis]|uniref:Protease B n=1 Tax=Myxococcus llanfairpwllgwyngyllgogerychwyrndrobwllllantysiliogogogochensis TaxID=2590453 RepID=A0A540X2Y8_9BACT|nr:M57 family metalloprotease [Myxococcus llanfairpwllgwyngyllgogerychwyrndrobwllllantysiliogogogochensis]TQF15573.1 protease B [Myxococcus llanfairpwllgwyngyllgogerychwyrndrobwllllantysiliogogogochensis]
MFKKAAVLVVSCGALLVGCGPDPQAENEEIISNLLEAGFPADDILVADDAVYVGRDAHVTLEASREMLQVPLESEEQYRTTNLVGSSVTRICVNSTATFDSYPMLSQGLDLAIANYNERGLRITFARGPATGCTANITAQTTSGTGGSAGFPSGGLPYGIINIGTGLNDYSADVNEHVITHELGHAVGFRHSDYYNRSISCGAGGDEGDAGVGAIHIPGTPTTAVVGGSVMNSCFRSTETGEWTSSDNTALDALYGGTVPSCSSYNFMSYRGQNGTQIRCSCPAVSGGVVWGTDLYTDDSNACAAAVHAGAIPATGGTVVVVIQPGQSSYTGTTRNGITTLSYGAWGGSFSFQLPPAQSCSSYNFTSYRGQNGTQIRCGCPAVSGGVLWGTDLYTDDSDACAAGVHAGVIPATGGTVVVTIQPGQSSYTGTTRNGITTLSYGAWGGSFSLGR